MQTKLRFLMVFGLLIVVICLGGCDRLSPTPTPQPQPMVTPVVAPQTVTYHNGSVTASGVVAPAKEAQLSFAQNGWVQEVNVEVGELVEAGQVLAELEGRERLEAAVITTETEVLAAQQALDDLYENIEVALAEAYQALIKANDAVGEAKRYLYYFVIPSHMESLSALEALSAASEKLDLAREVYEPYKNRSEWDYWRRKKIKQEEGDAKDQLEWAQNDYSTALRRLELESALITAQANLEKAIEEYEMLQEGPDPDDVAIAQARLKNAQSGLEVAKAALDQATMYAPFDSTAVTVDICAGETVMPGQVVIIMGTLSQLQVETSDLSERDVSQVAVGQAAIVYLEALNLEIDGRVVDIAPQADTIGGDVVYTVTIELDGQPEGLRWGMSAEVEVMVE